MTARIWLVTGGSTGIGHAVTETALRAGDRVVAVARDADALLPLQRLHGDALMTLRADLTQSAQIEDLVSKAIRAWGAIDVVLNSAGFRVDGALEEQSDEQIDRQIAVNLSGAIKLTRAVLPHMRRQRRGRFIHISSSAGQLGVAGFSLYTATKWGLEGFVESLALETVHLGIHATVVELGSFRTERKGVVEVSRQIDDYGASAGHARAARRSRIGIQRGDPARAAGVILELVDMDKPPLRVALGTDAFPQVTQAMEKRLADLRALEGMSHRTDFD